ncbi:MAG: dihydrofolate reductase [Lachnospiraceae bacterium]|nr:dihydrofolate reductase [Lachnospiraceae bacterium]
MKLIVAVDKNWAIGNKNKLLVSIPNDMKNFRRLTTGNVIVMGRKTLESFPQGKPLPNRVNIVLSGQKDYTCKDAVVVHSVDELKEKLAEYSCDVYVVGGGRVYKELLPLCDEAIVTKVDESYEADTYFPNLDEMDEWEIAEESEEQTCFDLCYTFVTYRRK